MREFTQRDIEEFGDGKKAAFDNIYAAFSPWLYGLCLRYTRCDADAQDVLQETFIRAYEARKTVDAKRSIAPWLKTIAIRCALNYIRSNYKYVPQGDEDFRDDCADESNDNSDWYAAKRELLLEALRKLPDGYRLVFGLYAVDQLTHKEIAAYLGISEGTSKSQYAKAKMKLKEILTLEKETV
jgi:RNA polymerase sigma-70 factor (ECF subfamily)